jgi:hypothetical protein
MSQAADSLDADLKSRLCLALNVVATAFVHEAVLVYSPTAETLLSALACGIATDSCQEPAPQWRFVSDQPETIANLAKSGGIALYLRDADAASFQQVGFNREATFGLNADRESLPRDAHLL